MIDVGNETLLTIPAAGRRLSKHPDTVRSWIKAGRLEGVRIAGVLHTSLEAIERASEPAREEDRPPREPASSRERKALQVLRQEGIAK